MLTQCQTTYHVTTRYPGAVTNLRLRPSVSPCAILTGPDEALASGSEQAEEDRKARAKRRDCKLEREEKGTRLTRDGLANGPNGSALLRLGPTASQGRVFRGSPSHSARGRRTVKPHAAARYRTSLDLGLAARIRTLSHVPKLVTDYRTPHRADQGPRNDAPETRCPRHGALAALSDAWLRSQSSPQREQNRHGMVPVEQVPSDRAVHW
jgi:hypothetical protein